MGKIIKFPDLMNQRPHHPDNWRWKPVELWTPLDSIEEARARISERDCVIESWKRGENVSREDYVSAIMVKEVWESLLSEREAKAAGSTLWHDGKAFVEMAGKA